MEASRAMDLSFLDQPSILSFIFYPRKEFKNHPGNGFDLFVPVESEISISSRFYLGHSQWPWILYFHGNGEVVSDYDELAPFYHQIEVNLVVADYRGYGASGGEPTLSHLLRDSHKIFLAIKEELLKRELRDEVWVMGRSLGSLSALELASLFHEEIKGLIIESGAISMVRVFRNLGVPIDGRTVEKIDREWEEKVSGISLPSLIIHGSRDRLVPVEEGRQLYRCLGSTEKKLLIIPEATHNDILWVGFKNYFKAIHDFIKEGHF